MKIQMTIGVSLLLGVSGCTVVPVPVATSMLAGIVPQPQPRPIPTSASYTTAPALPVTIATPTPALPVVNPPALIPSLSPPIPTAASVPTVLPKTAYNSNQDLSWLAERVFMNEVNNDSSKLITWNEQANYATLGLGRFVWYPAGQRGTYPESFPAFLAFVESNRTPLPTWLAQRPTRGGPWPDKAAFDRAQNDPQMQELRQFLRQTASLQAQFMVGRLKQNLPYMVQGLSAAERDRVLKNFQVMEQSPGGLYPLLDYVHFKGDGTNPAERYQGQGWGLVQVLQNMEVVTPGTAALAEFMRSADDVLMRRIANAPSERREARLLSQWQQRIQSYKTPLATVASR